MEGKDNWSHSDDEKFPTSWDSKNTAGVLRTHWVKKNGENVVQISLR